MRPSTGLVLCLSFLLLGSCSLGTNAATSYTLPDGSAVSARELAILKGMEPQVKALAAQYYGEVDGKSLGTEAGDAEFLNSIRALIKAELGDGSERFVFDSGAASAAQPSGLSAKGLYGHYFLFSAWNGSRIPVCNESYFLSVSSDYIWFPWGSYNYVQATSNTVCADHGVTYTNHIKDLTLSDSVTALRSANNRTSPTTASFSPAYLRGNLKWAFWPSSGPTGLAGTVSCEGMLISYTNKSLTVVR